MNTKQEDDLINKQKAEIEFLANVKIQLLNDNTEELINTPTSLLVRWGITIIVFFFVLVFFASWYIKYPDVITTNLKLVSNNNPKTITSPINGSIKKILIKEGKKVEKGEVLFFLESTAQHDEVLKLEKTIDTLIYLIRLEKVKDFFEYNVDGFYDLGELQKSYEIFQISLLDSKAASLNGLLGKKKTSIKDEIAALKKLENNVKKRIELLEKDLEISFEELNGQKQLSEKGYVSKHEYINIQSKYLNKMQLLELEKGELEKVIISQRQKEQEIFMLEKSESDKKNLLVQSANTLKSDIQKWKKTYVLEASTSGKVIFLNSLQENQIVKANQELTYILPEKSDYYGEMFVGQYNFGKIKIGQKVAVKFQSYPYQEFGIVKGRVIYISDIPKDSKYLVKIDFPLGLITSSQKMLTFTNGMIATGEIITEDLNLLERIFFDLRKTIRN